MDADAISRFYEFEQNYVGWGLEDPSNLIIYKTLASCMNKSSLRAPLTSSKPSSDIDSREKSNIHEIRFKNGGSGEVIFREGENSFEATSYEDFMAMEEKDIPEADVWIGAPEDKVRVLQPLIRRLIRIKKSWALWVPMTSVAQTFFREPDVQFLVQGIVIN